MLHAATCVFIICWHADRVIVSRFYFSVKTTHPSLTIEQCPTKHWPKKEYIKTTHCECCKHFPGVRKKHNRSALFFLRHISRALPRCHLHPPPPPPSGYEWPSEEIWRDFGFTSTSKAPSIYFTLLSIQHPNLFQHFSKLQIYIFVKAEKRIDSGLQIDNDNDGGEAANELKTKKNQKVKISTSGLATMHCSRHLDNCFHQNWLPAGKMLVFTRVYVCM